MRERARHSSPAARCAVLLAVLLLAGGLVWYAPPLLRIGPTIAEVPAPPAMFTAASFVLPPHGTACETLVTVTPDSRAVSFRVNPVGHPRGGGAPLELTLVGPGYRGSTVLGGGYPGGFAELPLSAPPSHPVVATACFLNHGTSSVALDGTAEVRTIARPQLTVDGHPVAGDIELTFNDTQPHRLIARLGTLFTHASNLTDGLIPVWMIWIIAVLVALGVPLAVIGAFYLAVRADEAGATGPPPRTAPSG